MMAERGMIPLSAVVAIDLTQHAYHGKGRRGRPRRPVQGWHLVVRDVHGRRDADGGPHARRLHHARPEAGTCQARDRRVQEGRARGAVSKHKINAKKGAKGKRREFTMVVVKGFKIKGGRRVAACLVFATNMSVDGAMDALSSIQPSTRRGGDRDGVSHGQRGARPHQEQQRVDAPVPVLLYADVPQRVGHGQLRGGHREDPGGAPQEGQDQEGEEGGGQGPRPRPEKAEVAAQLAQRRHPGRHVRLAAHCGRQNVPASAAAGCADLLARMALAATWPAAACAASI